MRQGMDFDGMRVMGLDEFLEQLRQEMRERYREVNLKNALSEMEQKLEDLLNQERKTLDSLKGKKPGVEDKNRELSKMPRKLSEAIRKLESYDFEDADAKEAFDELLEEYENIRDLENFKDRNQHLFHGPKSLNYEQSLDLMKEMERMRQLEQDLMSGNFDTISMEDLQQMLGQQAMQDFKNLKQVMVLLNNSGYLMPKGEHSQLSPKGVRRIGQLALRDIFQSLLKDRAGSHTTDHRGVTEIRPDETKTYAFGDPLNLNLVGTLKKALARKPGRAAAAQPRGLRDLRKRLRQLLLDGAMPRYVVVDELGRTFCRGEESRDGDGDAHPLEVPPRFFLDRRIFYPRGRTQAEGSPRGVLEHGRSVHQSAGWTCASPRICSIAIRRAISRSS